MKNFVVICGPGRSGTSLATKLVEACGYRLGKTNEPNIPHKWEGLRAGYGEHPLSNAQHGDIESAIDKLEEQDANAIKLIHLYAQWIPRLQKRDYNVHVVVTSRDESEIWASGLKLYTGWQPEAIQAICGTAKRILRETRAYLNDSTVKAFELPFQKVVERDKVTLYGLVDFLCPSINLRCRDEVYEKVYEIVRPDIVQHAGVDEKTL